MPKMFESRTSNPYGQRPTDALTSESQVKPTSFKEGLKTAYEVANQYEALGSSIARLYTLKGEAERFKDAPKLPPSELNKLFPNMPEPFTRPMPKIVGQMIYDRQQERQKLEEKIAKGPQGFAYTAGTFGASMLGYLTDPAEAGVGFLTGGLFAAGRVINHSRRALKAGKRLNQALKFGIAEQRAIRSAESAGQAFVNMSAENFAANVVTEPFIQAVNSYEGTKVETSQVLANVAIGSVGISGLMLGIRKGAELISSKGPLARQFLSDAGASQIMQNKRLELSHIFENEAKALRESRGFDKKLGFDYEFRSLDDMNLKEISMYGASQGGVVLHKDLGRGVYISDNPDLVNASIAGALNNQKNMKVTEFRIKEDAELKAFDLKKELAEDVASEVKERFKVTAKTGEELVEKIKEKVEDGDLPRTALDDLDTYLKEKGYNAMRHEGGKINGYDAGSHNVLKILDEDILEEGLGHSPDKKMISGLSDQESRDFFEMLNSRTMDRDFTEEGESLFRSVQNNAESDTRSSTQFVNDKNKQIEELSTTLKEMDQQSDRSLIKEDISEVDDFRERSVRLNEAIEQIIPCVGGAN